MKQALIVMAKRPEAGKTKTRLSPPLTLPQAAELYECFLMDIVAIIRELRLVLPNMVPFFAYSPEESAPYFTELAPDFSLVPQIGDTLGERLDYVLSSCLNQGFAQAAAINSDSPNLPVNFLARAFRQLDSPHLSTGDSAVGNAPTTDIVFGPSEDGGYYLIGTSNRWLATSWSRIVREVTMSTPTVLEDSLRVAEEVSAAVGLLPPWYDIDTVDELKRLYQECSGSDGNGAKNTVSYTEEKLGRLLKGGT